MAYMQCRSYCGACCTAPSITTPLPGLPKGKPAGVACRHLDDDLRCQIFNDPTRPAVCTQLKATPEMCGKTREYALHHLTELEKLTSP